MRNLDDGTLEAILEGPDPNVQAVLDLLREGPAHARVEWVDIEFGAATGTLPAIMVAL